MNFDAGASPPSPADLASAIQVYLADHPHAVLLEDGRVLFDMRRASYSIDTEHGRCLLHIWSEERNVIRRITGFRPRKDSLFLETQRMGQAKPQTIEFASTGNRKVAGTQASIRSRYVRVLERVLTRNFPEFKVEDLRSAMDLTRSFGPAYARGVQVRGQVAWAVCIVSGAESQAVVDGALTIGILWLDHCRERAGRKLLFSGLRMILPQGTTAVTFARIAWLNSLAAKWELYALNEQTEELTLLDPSDFGNLSTHLTHASNDVSVQERFASQIRDVLALLPPDAGKRIEIRTRDANETALLLHGVDFARLRLTPGERSFRRTVTVTFGAGANETPLTPESEDLFRRLTTELFTRRVANWDSRDPLYRMQPERWLESELRHSLESLDSDLQPTPVYSQVPAFSAGDRGMVDLLGVTRTGRLAVLELKASEDLHLPLQGLDYWMRVRWHLREFQQFGYFPGVELSAHPPLLYLVAPALHVHPAVDTVLRYFPPAVEWRLIGLDERWREKIAVVFRKRSGDLRA